jgi:hypothetical protein
VFELSILVWVLDEKLRPEVKNFPNEMSFFGEFTFEMLDSKYRSIMTNLLIKY